MARVLYSTHIDEIKGSVGGLSFHRNSAGTIMRLKPSRVQSPTGVQSVQQTIFNRAVAAWAAMDWGNQNDWNVFAATHPKTNYWGESKVLSGYNWFLSCCNYAFIMGHTYPTAPPTWSTPLAIPSYGYQINASSFNLYFGSGFVHSDQHLFVFASPPLLSTGLKNRKLLRLLKIIAPGTTIICDILAEWLSIYGFTSMPAPGPGRYFINVAVATVHKTYYFASAYNSQNLSVEDF